MLVKIVPAVAVDKNHLKFLAVTLVFWDEFAIYCVCVNNETIFQVAILTSQL